MITPPAFEMDPLSLAKSMAVQLSDFSSDVSGRAARLARGAKGVDDALGGERADSANVDRRRRRLRALGAKLELPRRNDEAVVLLLGVRSLLLGRGAGSRGSLTAVYLVAPLDIWSNILAGGKLKNKSKVKN